MNERFYHHRMLSALYLVPIALLALAGSANAADSTINITGTVVASPCTVEAVKNVDLGDIDASKLATTGSTSPFVTFSVDLTDCPATTTGATATFTGTASHTDYYANTGTAKHVDVELAASYSSDNKGNGSIYGTTINSSTHAGSFGLKARVRNDGEGSAVTPGSVSSAIQLTIGYK